MLGGLWHRASAVKITVPGRIMNRCTDNYCQRCQEHLVRLGLTSFKPSGVFRASENGEVIIRGVTLSLTYLKKSWRWGWKGMWKGLSGAQEEAHWNEVKTTQRVWGAIGEEAILACLHPECKVCASVPSSFIFEDSDVLLFSH